MKTKLLLRLLKKATWHTGIKGIHSASSWKTPASEENLIKAAPSKRIRQSQRNYKFKEVRHGDLIIVEQA